MNRKKQRGARRIRSSGHNFLDEYVCVVLAAYRSLQLCVISRNGIFMNVRVCDEGFGA